MSVNLYMHIVCVLGWGKTDCCFRQKAFLKSVQRLNIHIGFYFGEALMCYIILHTFNETNIQCKSFTKNKTAFSGFLKIFIFTLKYFNSPAYTVGYILSTSCLEIATEKFNLTKYKLQNIYFVKSKQEH